MTLQVEAPSAVVANYDVLVARVLDGDRSAWSEIVAGLSRIVWASVSRFRLTDAERDDAYGATFLRLYEHLGSIREPARLPGWISTVARNEVHAILRARRRFDAVVAVSSATIEMHTTAVVDEDSDMRTAVRRAFDRLPESSRALLALLLAEPPLTYAEISIRLGIPVGAIGPTRQRCLNRLRRSPELLPFMDRVTQ